MTDLRKAVEGAIEALQTAVKFANNVGYGGWKDTAVQCHEATASLRAALEAALKTGEPVAKYIGECPMGSLVQLYDDLKDGTYLYGAAPPAQTPPPLLTEPQIQWCWNTACHHANKFDQHIAFARAIESAVRHQFTNT